MSTSTTPPPLGVAASDSSERSFLWLLWLVVLSPSITTAVEISVARWDKTGNHLKIKCPKTVLSTTSYCWHNDHFPEPLHH